MVSDKFSRLELKNKITVIIALVAVVVACIAYFIILPTVAEIRRINDEILSQRTDLEAKYVKGQSLNKLSNNLKLIDPKLAALDEVFINQNRALEFITILEQISADNGVEQKINLMTDKGAQENDYKRVPLQLLATGDFQDLARYLSSLESLKYYINITNIDMIRKEDKESGTKVVMQIMSNTYWK